MAVSTRRDHYPTRVSDRPDDDAGGLTEVRSAHVGGQQVDPILGNEPGALPHIEGQ
jgi:hypothetical protein